MKPRARRRRRPVAIALVLLAVGPVARATVAQAVPLQGLYEECPPAHAVRCAGELTRIASGGFRVVLNYSAWYGTAREIRAYAKSAAARGLELIWPLNAAPWRNRGRLAVAYPELARSCRCKTNARLFRYAIDLVRTLPATWGYYVGDELRRAHWREVATLSAQVRALDAAHHLLYIGSWSPSPLFNLPRFTSSTDLIGADVYPIGLGEGVSAVGRAAMRVLKVAAGAGRQSAMVLQAFSWGEYPSVPNAGARWPSAAEMRRMYELALAANPALVLWYSYFDIVRSRAPLGHWRDLLYAAFGRPLPRAPNPSR